MIEIGESVLREAVRTVWATTLGLEVEVVPAPSRASSALSGSVRVSGLWRGAVSLDCPPQLASQAAARMFGVDPRETTRDQRLDAIGELTNIIGGNVKAFLPGPSRLSPPKVIEGPDGLPEPNDPEAMTRLDFQCLDESFRVTVRRESTG